MCVVFVAACNSKAHEGSAAPIPIPNGTTSTAGTSAGASGVGGAGGATEPGGNAGSGMAGTGAGTGASDPTDPGAMDPGTMDSAGKPLAMDECGLHTGYAGDEYCILPPPPDQGFQLHIGPSDYDNPEAEYVLAPKQEITSDFNAVSGNDKDVYFYYRQFRMRPGAHHNIVTTDDGGGFGLGRRIGTSNLLAEDSPKSGIIAPENEGVGIPLAARSGINVSLHSINTTDKPQLREVWINFWYRGAAKVTEPVEEMFQTGSMSFAVLPGQDTVLGPYRCTLQGNGRMLWMYGHRHANNVRFSTWRVRGQKRDLIYQGYHWEEPMVLEFSSTVKNPEPDTAPGVEGGWSGVLELQDGDELEWECHVVNGTDGVLRFTNNTYTGEMCIVDAELVGTNCNLF